MLQGLNEQEQQQYQNDDHSLMIDTSIQQEYDSAKETNYYPYKSACRQTNPEEHQQIQQRHNSQQVKRQTKMFSSVARQLNNLNLNDNENENGDYAPIVQQQHQDHQLPQLMLKKCKTHD